MEKFTISEKAFIEQSKLNNKMTMNWQGSIDTDNSNDRLGTFLSEFHMKCKTNGIQELEINFHAVDFMNSSGIKSIISWMRDVSDDNTYKACVYFDSEVSWQDITFATFRQLIKNVEFIPK